jgi:hypothetical protein
MTPVVRVARTNSCKSQRGAEEGFAHGSPVGSVEIALARGGLEVDPGVDRAAVFVFGDEDLPVADECGAAIRLFDEHAELVSGVGVAVEVKVPDENVDEPDGQLRKSLGSRRVWGQVFC